MNEKVSKEEIHNLIENFANSLGFGDVATMKQTAYQFKSMNLSSNIDSESDFSCVSPSQDPCPRKSLCSTSVMMENDNERDAVEFEPYQRKARKSRKSVCVLPKIVMSSSDEDEEDDDKETCQQQSEDSDGEITSQKSKRCPKIIESSDETESDGNVDGNVSEESRDKESFDRVKKQINYIGSSDDEDIEMLSQTFKRQTLTENKKSHQMQNDENYKQYIAGSNSGSESNTDSEGSLKDFIVSDDEDNDEVTDKDNSLVIVNKGHKDDSVSKILDSDNDSDDDDFDNFCQTKMFKTPVPSSTNNQRKVLQEKNYQKFLTPHSQSKRLLSEFATPKSLPGTPAYKRDFNKKRENVISELFQLFNKTIFGGQLPADMQITWNKRMTKTAGFCYYSKSFSIRKCRIELSDKVIDSVERIRDTLVHELCHAAAWMINGVQAGHGPCWKSWAKKANIAHPELPIISRCHQYEIKTKYNYLCNGCGTTFGRHSKSIDAAKHRCAKCGGIPELVQDKTVAATPKTPNVYAQFVKDNFATVKKSNPGKPHREIMMIISEKFRGSKKSEVGF